MAASIISEKTLGDVMRAAVTKSRRLSSPKSKAGMRIVVLQNRIVNDVNSVLVKMPLSTKIVDIDAHFIALGEQISGAQMPLAPLTALWQLQHATNPLTTGSSALMACPSEDLSELMACPSEDLSELMACPSEDLSELMACTSEDLSELMACPSEEFTVIGEDDENEEFSYYSNYTSRKRSADVAFD